VVETYVEGTEIQVGLLDGELLGAVEIAPNREFYDYEAKYQEGGADHHIPPRVPEDLLDTCLTLGKRAYETLHCSGLARVDLIAPADAPPIVLEVNTIPGMTHLSLAPEIAAHAGIGFDELVTRIMNGARLHL
jgi:D-alanine-D-alanine ligase